MLGETSLARIRCDRSDDPISFLVACGTYGQHIRRCTEFNVLCTCYARSLCVCDALNACGSSVSLSAFSLCTARRRIDLMANASRYSRNNNHALTFALLINRTRLICPAHFSRCNFSINITIEVELYIFKGEHTSRFLAQSVNFKIQVINNAISRK